MEDHEFPLLEEAISKLWDKSHEFGLDPFPVHFEVVPPAIMYEFGAYLLPGRFQHWTHGKASYPDGDTAAPLTPSGYLQMRPERKLSLKSGMWQVFEY